MEIRTVGILGAGTMGLGIAQAAAISGFNVNLYDLDEKMLEKAEVATRDTIQKHFVDKGKLSKEDGSHIVASIRMMGDFDEAIKDADFVLEAVPENLELKKSIFEKLGRLCLVHTILATNTSALPVTAIAGASGRLEKCIGTHFFNPAVVMKLVEVVLPVGVSEETVDTTLAVCKKMGKVAVKVKDRPGFIVNRILKHIYKEAAQMVYEGAASPDEIDLAMKLGAGHPMGPCELTDMAGFDLMICGSEELYKYTLDEEDKVHLFYRKMAEAGRLGRKNGKGYYDYLPDGTKRPFKGF